MDSKICTNVNYLLYNYNSLNDEVTTLKDIVENDTPTIVADLINSNITVKDLNANNITADEDIFCRNLTASNTVTADNLVTDDFNADDITCNNFNADDVTCDKITSTIHIGNTANITNIYSIYSETQTCVIASDKNLKKKITNVTTDYLRKLRPVSFKYINNDQKKVYGLIAQEVEPYYPDMVFTLKNGKKAIDYNQLISLLIFKTNGLEERLESIEKIQESIKTFMGLIILTLFIIIILIFLPKKYLNLKNLLRGFS